MAHSEPLKSFFSRITVSFTCTFFAQPLPTCTSVKIGNGSTGV